MGFSRLAIRSASVKKNSPLDKVIAISRNKVENLYVVVGVHNLIFLARGRSYDEN